jgi:branched-subunit amino acid aminotransferase/4-amino-4-deoxychorismate lyase
MAQPEQFDELWWADPALKERILKEPLVVLKERGINAPTDLPLPVAYEVLRLVSLLWVNGKLIRKEQFWIDPLDEGLMFGRGVWESTRTIGGVPWLWPLHLDRLKRTAAALQIEIDPARLPDDQHVAQFARALSSRDVIIRLNVSAGRLNAPGLVWMTASIAPQPRGAVRLASCRTPVVKGHPWLTWKTFHYANRLRHGEEAIQAGFDSALMLDEQGNILEAAHANIFLRLQDGWVTPPVQDGLLLPGTVREFLLKNSPFPIREQVVPKSQLAEVSEVFLTGSSVGIVPVAGIDQQPFSVGMETNYLRRWLLPNVDIT